MHGLRAPQRDRETEREIIGNLTYLFHVMSESQALNADCINVAMASLAFDID